MLTKTFVKLTKAKQERIFQSALKEFATKGYSLASTNNICKEAEISKGSMFQYFENKENLFLFVVRKALSEVINVYKKNYILDIEDMSLKDIFINSCFHLLKFYEMYPYHYKLYLRINYEMDAPNYKELRRYLVKYVSAITHQFIELGKKRNLLRNDINSDLALFFINSVLNRFIEVCFEPGIEPVINYNIVSKNKEEIIEEIYKFLLEGLGVKN
ncbi:MAG TPA: TetR/AcrR family transcriptional regulator [Spirochaetota bacterium]|nr:TetR/AcrR family transcriptional regulator [Spirochaetota bacterium]HOL56085.1 TetR/AcrR family transcriptional regulator [Spirochaetota bacterium]HPP03501.1 TetR/AcrR family transcriptional regulator [Spirochaetota bacterium]